MNRCTNQGHQKSLDSKDDNTEKHCPVTVNPWHMKKAFKVMNELRRYYLTYFYFSVVYRGSQVVLVVKNLPAIAGDLRDVGLIPGSGRSPEGGHGKPLQYSCLENA